MSRTGGQIIDPSSNNEAEEDMDTTEPPEELIAIIRNPLTVRARSGYDMTNTIRKLLRSNPEADREMFFKNLKTILEREEKKIRSDLEASILDIDNPKTANQKQKRAIIRAMTHTLSGWTSKLYYDATDREAKRKLERLKARKAGAQAQTSTPKKTGRKSPKKNRSKTDGEKLETKKRTRDEVDTNYSTDDDVIPSECDDEAKIMIHSTGAQ